MSTLTISSILTSTKSKNAQELIDVIVDHSKKGDVVKSERGPYSHSRLDISCMANFKFSYIDRAQPAITSMFDTELGKAFHDAAELDIRMRVMHPKESWISPEALVDQVIQQNPQYMEFSSQTAHQLELFRSSFKINPDSYVGSEEELAVDFAMQPVRFDSENAWFRGKVDYLEVDTNGTARVVDFKNYPTIISSADLNNINKGFGHQLMGYMMLAMAKNKSIKQACGEIYYSRFGCSRSFSDKDEYGKPQTKYFSRDEVEAWFKNLQRKMLSRERLPLKDFVAQPSQKSCQYCGFINQCPVKLTENDSILRNMEEAEKALEELAYLEEKRKRLKAVLEHYAKGTGMIRTSGGAMIAYMPDTEVSFDVKSALSVLAEANNNDLEKTIDFLAKNISLTKTSVESIARKLPPNLKKKLAETRSEQTKTRLITKL